MNLSLRKRLLVLLLMAIVIGWLFAAMHSYYDTRDEVEDLFDAQLAQSARALLTLSSHELSEQLAYLAQQEQPEKHREQITALDHKYEQQIAFQIWQGKERLLVRSDNAPRSPMTHFVNEFDTRVIDGKKWRVFALLDEQNDIHVQVGEEHRRRDQISNDIALHIFTVIIVILPFLAALIWISVGNALAPLVKIARDVTKREFDNLQPISIQGVPEEVRPLVTALNGLFERLETAFTNIRRFTGDAAHELRTPIAALKTHAQVAYRGTDPVEIRKSIAAAITGADRASHVVEQMLTLARLDPESQVIKFEEVDMCQVAESQIADIANLAWEKGIDLGLHCQARHLVKGKAALLAVLVRNLTENALSCVPKNGKVEISIAEKADCIILEVADNGPGIPEAERAKVFDRFYRGKNQAHSGTGLGLSIVKRIVELHHATIHLDSSSLGGLLVRVSLQTTSGLSAYQGSEEVQIAEARD